MASAQSVVGEIEANQQAPHTHENEDGHHRIGDDEKLSIGTSISPSVVATVGYPESWVPYPKHSNLDFHFRVLQKLQEHMNAEEEEHAQIKELLCCRLERFQADLENERKVHEAKLEEYQSKLAEFVPKKRRSCFCCGRLPDETAEADDVVLKKAAHNGHETMATSLAKVGANVDMVCPSDGRMPVNLAAAEGDDAIVSSLIEAATNVHLAIGQDMTPICPTSQVGHETNVEALIASEAYIDRPTDTGTTPILMASKTGHSVLVKALIAAEADVDRADDQGDTPCTIAAYEGHESVVCALVAAKADLDTADSGGNTGLKLAAQNGHIAVVSILIDSKANVDKANREGTTPVLAAIKSLVAAKAIDGPMANGGTPSNTAAGKGHDEVALALIEARADVDIAYNQGVTPLFLLINGGHESLVRAFCEAGASIDMAENTGHSPVDAATDCLNLQVESRHTSTKS